jgi:hypothetical protein
MTMVDGLKLTLSGEELRKLLADRIADHHESADHWRQERSRTPESQTEDAPLLSDHMCEHEVERHVWRAAVLEFIRGHVDEHETYRLGAGDLEFGELLPSKPGSIEQEDYEERTAIGFQLERLTKGLGELAACALPAAMARAVPDRTEWEPPPGYKVTRVDVEDGPEIKIERTDIAE